MPFEKPLHGSAVSAYHDLPGAFHPSMRCELSPGLARDTEPQLGGVAVPL